MVVKVTTQIPTSSFGSGYDLVRFVSAATVPIASSINKQTNYNAPMCI